MQLKKFKKDLEKRRKAFLVATLDNENPISMLRGNKYILYDLFELVEKEEYNKFYKQFINKIDVPFMIWPRPYIQYPCFGNQIIISSPINFPLPKDININMMPILCGYGIFKSLPEYCFDYASFIWDHCFALGYYFENNEIKNRIGYLTIHEGWVDVGETQRRSGLHIERPGNIKAGGKWSKFKEEDYNNIAWGLGRWHEDGLPVDGIYMANSINNSCAIWPALIDNPHEVTDEHGGIEHMREFLGEPRLLQANEMCWFTDRTPHESLPIKAPENDQKATKVYRQFFRLVVGKISIWYSKHNTPNPLGIQPDCIISDEDKFN